MSHKNEKDMTHKNEKVMPHENVEKDMPQKNGDGDGDSGRPK